MTEAMLVLGVDIFVEFRLLFEYAAVVLAFGSLRTCGNLYRFVAFFTMYKCIHSFVWNRIETIAVYSMLAYYRTQGSEKLRESRLFFALEGLPALYSALKKQ